MVAYASSPHLPALPPTLAHARTHTFLSRTHAVFVPLPVSPLSLPTQVTNLWGEKNIFDLMQMQSLVNAVSGSDPIPPPPASYPMAQQPMSQQTPISMGQPMAPGAAPMASPGPIASLTIPTMAAPPGAVPGAAPPAAVAGPVTTNPVFPVGGTVANSDLNTMPVGSMVSIIKVS